MSLSLEYLKSVLEYDPISGYFIWIKGSRTNRIAGTERPDGYRQICIEGTLYLEHRLAWFYMTGEWPIQVDHRNACRNDNTWENLRNATHSQNKMHTPIQANNTTGYKGVRFDWRRQKYMANIKKDNESIFLGYFGEATEAYKAYTEAALKLHGEFAQLS